MSEQTSLGVITHDSFQRKTDYLYRVSVKCLIQNEKGEVLVVKETGRDWWDLPGGGMDHHESIKSAIAREMKEEVNLEGDFIYKILDIDEPTYLSPHDFWQIRLIYRVTPENMSFSAGEDGDEVSFMSPNLFKNSPITTEQKIYRYANIMSRS
jgi:8-oxo-dGTP pyrophosphatase MutT (NUDIX family)